MLNHPMEPPLNDGVVRSMKGNKGKGTKPELVVRKALREAGYPGYRLNWRKAPGRPDICYPGRKVAVFVNGCFWHQCPVCHPHLPRHNSDYWIPKLRRNVERDAEKTAALEEKGWTVVVVWECELKKNPNEAISRIVSVLEGSKLRIRPQLVGYPSMFVHESRIHGVARRFSHPLSLVSSKERFERLFAVLTTNRIRVLYAHVFV